MRRGRPQPTVVVIVFLALKKNSTQMQRRKIIRAKLKRVIILYYSNNNNVLPSVCRHSPDNLVITAPDHHNPGGPISRRLTSRVLPATPCKYIILLF